MTNVSKLKLFDSAISSVQKTMDFLYEGNAVNARRCISEMKPDGLFSNMLSLQEKITHFIESGKILFAYNATKSLLDLLKKEKRDAIARLEVIEVSHLTIVNVAKDILKDPTNQTLLSALKNAAAITDGPDQ